ncbi:alpha/beta hydrolase [Paraflavitalea pollutisoli]|uniref:alpha/beta hydrolase n=1 Tax=Paraflavitalea pollutisoli TaxID=3034143 RepID=UPI0023EC0A4D|nr:alpha/beta hydrolase [Paraflavitalea sp. H1-2-19X]
MVVAQHPLNAFDNDVAALKRVLDQQTGPCILVAHSYGGSIIADLGNDPKVSGLMYIAAQAMDVGETQAGNGKRYPPAYKSLLHTPDGYDYIEPERFAADFAGDPDADRANFMANAQVPTANAVFHISIARPAWKTKPSWYMVDQSDRIINPDLERLYAKRSKSKTVKPPAPATQCT